MQFLTIDDSFGGFKLGEPIEVDENGLFFRFSEIDNVNEKASFMRKYRLLPCENNQGAFACDDSNEFDAIRAVMDTCARLAAFGYGYCVGERKPKQSDLEHIDGLEFVDGGAFLHIDLTSSYWYKRLLYKSVSNYAFSEGDGLFPPIHDFDLSDKTRIESKDDLPATQDMKTPFEALKINSGSFKYRPGIDNQLLEELRKRSDERTFDIYRKSILIDMTYRNGFLQFCPVPDLRYEGHEDDLPFIDESIAAFWTDNELILKAEGETPEKITALLSEHLAQLHTESMMHYFKFHRGFWLVAPIGLSALWADFVQCIAKRPVTICEICGKPVVSDKTPRGQKRHTCSPKCRKERSRREQAKKAAEMATE